MNWWPTTPNGMPRGHLQNTDRTNECGFVSQTSMIHATKKLRRRKHFNGRKPTTTRCVAHTLTREVLLSLLPNRMTLTQSSDEDKSPSKGSMDPRTYPMDAKLKFKIP